MNLQLVQVHGQLNRWGCLLQVRDLTHLPFAERELMLIKIAANAAARRDVLDIADIFRAKAVDVSGHTITLQVIFLPQSVRECCSSACI